MILPASITIFRRAERGADLVTQLLLFESRCIRASIASLYTPVPRKFRAIYRRIQIKADRQKIRQLRKEARSLNEILNDPNASDEYKRLARISLVVLEDPQIIERARSTE